VKISNQLAILCTLAAMSAAAQQPPQPIDISPNDGEIYYLINQRDGLQVDAARTEDRGRVSVQPRSFSSTSQRWALQRAARSNHWEIRSVASGLCLKNDEQRVELDECTEDFGAGWELTPVSNGYYTVRNAASHRLLDLTGRNASTVTLAASESRGPPAQSQLWLLRPAFFRGVDNALLEKQEALRVMENTPWWKDNGQPQDVLSMFKNHGCARRPLLPMSIPAPPAAWVMLVMPRPIPRTSTWPNGRAISA